MDKDSRSVTSRTEVYRKLENYEEEFRIEHLGREGGQEEIRKR